MNLIPILIIEGIFLIVIFIILYFLEVKVKKIKEDFDDLEIYSNNKFMDIDNNINKLNQDSKVFLESLKEIKETIEELKCNQNEIKLNVIEPRKRYYDIIA